MEGRLNCEAESGRVGRNSSTLLIRVEGGSEEENRSWNGQTTGNWLSEGAHFYRVYPSGVYHVYIVHYLIPL